MCVRVCVGGWVCVGCNVSQLGLSLGKTSLMDCLGAQCGLLSDEKIGEARFAHVRQDEKEKGCTLCLS